MEVRVQGSWGFRNMWDKPHTEAVGFIPQNPSNTTGHFLWVKILLMDI